MANLLLWSAFLIDEVRTFHLHFTSEIQGIVLKENLDFWIILYALLHDFRSAEIRLAHDHIHFLAQAS